MTWQTKVVRGALALAVFAMLAIGSGAFLGWFDSFGVGWYD